MLRIGKMADYALLITNRLALSKNELWTTDQIVENTQLPTATVRKLLKKLVDAGIVNSFRGINGGYNLAKDPSQLTVADVLTAIEGPISLTECNSNKSDCNLITHCELQSNWQFLNNVVEELFKKITLKDMSRKMSRRRKPQPTLPTKIIYR